LTHEAGQEALEARLVVEVELVGLAAKRAMKSDFHAAERALERLREAGAEGRETSEFTLEFHRILASAGYSTFLQRKSAFLDHARIANSCALKRRRPM
jgi:DNA-binding FadR family transcriptional regulator